MGIGTLRQYHQLDNQKDALTPTTPAFGHPSKGGEFKSSLARGRERAGGEGEPKTKTKTKREE